MKIAQGWNVFMCDFVESVKLAQIKLYKLYYDPYTKFDDPTFDEFNVINPKQQKPPLELVLWPQWRQGCGLLGFFFC